MNSAKNELVISFRKFIIWLSEFLLFQLILAKNSFNISVACDLQMPEPVWWITKKYVKLLIAYFTISLLLNTVYPTEWNDAEKLSLTKIFLVSLYYTAIVACTFYFVDKIYSRKGVKFPEILTFCLAYLLNILFLGVSLELLIRAMSYLNTEYGIFGFVVALESDSIRFLILFLASLLLVASFNFSIARYFELNFTRWLASVTLSILIGVPVYLLFHIPLLPIANLPDAHFESIEKAFKLIDVFVTM